MKLEPKLKLMLKRAPSNSFVWILILFWMLGCNTSRNCQNEKDKTYEATSLRSSATHYIVSTVSVNGLKPVNQEYPDSIVGTLVIRPIVLYEIMDRNRFCNIGNLCNYLFVNLITETDLELTSNQYEKVRNNIVTKSEIDSFLKHNRKLIQKSCTENEIYLGNFQLDSYTLSRKGLILAAILYRKGYVTFLDHDSGYTKAKRIGY